MKSLALTLGDAMHYEERHGGGLPSSPDYTRALHYIAAAILYHANTMKEGFRSMANNFDELKAAVAAVEAGIRSVADAIANPAVDNNDQAVIDQLSGQLKIAADALAAATAAENAEDGVVAPVETPADPAPTDGTGSEDVTP